MVEILKSVEIKVVIDTSADTYSKTFELGDAETVNELLARAEAWIRVHMP